MEFVNSNDYFHVQSHQNKQIHLLFGTSCHKIQQRYAFTMFRFRVCIISIFAHIA